MCDGVFVNKKGLYCVVNAVTAAVRIEKLNRSSWWDRHYSRTEVGVE